MPGVWQPTWSLWVLWLLVATLVRPTTGKRPNLVMILTDDQDGSVAGGDWHMPKLREHLAQKGANFTNHILNFALCCPSRATILVGQCAHNSGIVSLYYPLGGTRRFRERGLESRAVPLILQKAGYRTGLVGKYLNGYGTEFSAAYVPPGYDTWFGMRQQGYYNIDFSDNGQNVHLGNDTSDYSTDVIAARAVKFIEEASTDDRPFWLLVAPFAPHTPFVPARRHMDKLKGLIVPRVPSWNESSASLSKKIPRTLSDPRYNPPLSLEEAAAWDHDYQRRAEMLLSVDEAIDAIVKALQAVGKLNNTYIMYASDNGLKLGHRRKTSKQSPYEEDVRVPLYVRGPGLPAGIKLPHLITNADFAPTWLELANVTDPYAKERDGKSFAAVLKRLQARGEPDSFRTGVLIEMILRKLGATHVPDAGPHSTAAQGRRRLEEVAWTSNASSLTESIPSGQVLPRGRDGWSGAGCMGHLSDDDFEWPNDDLEGAPELGSKRDWQMYKALRRRRGIMIQPPKQPYLEGRRRLSELEPLPVLRADFALTYTALRVQSTLGSYKFIHYTEHRGSPAGFELYHLNQDPWEIHNIYSSASKALVQYLNETLLALETCRGRGCQLVGAQGLAKALGITPEALHRPLQKAA